MFPLGGELDDLEIRKISKKLEREIESIPEVARVVYRGLRNYEIRVEANPKKLAAYQLSLDDLVKALARQNLSIPGGVLEEGGGKELIVRTVGEFKDIEDVRETVIRANDMGNAVFVKDVAEVTFGLEEASIYIHTNGHPSLTLTVLKKEKADTITLVDKIKKRLEEIKPELGKGVELAIINDSSYYIRRRLKVLANNLGIGLALVLVALTLLLNFRVAMITAVGIPFSFLGAILIFNYFGVSLNLITMMGFIIVIGMLVDDAVVVTENAVRRIEEGEPPKEAAVNGTYQIWGPVMASVSSTIVVFLPLMNMSGIFGKFVKYIPIGVIVALLVSLFECFFILPHHVNRWVTKKHLRKSDKKTFWERVILPFYTQKVRWVLHHRYLVAVGAILLFVGSIFLGSRMSYVNFPPEGVEIFMIMAETSTGTSLVKTRAHIKPVEDIIKSLPEEELEDFVTMIGMQQGRPDDPNTRRGTEYAQIIVYLTPEPGRDRNAKEIIEDLRKKVGLPPGLKKINFERIKPGPPSGGAIEIGVRGRNYEDILPAVSAINALLKDLPGVSDLADSYILGKQEIQIKVNQVEAAAAGLSMATIGNTVRAAYEGLVATTIRELDEEIDVRVTLPQSSKSDLKSLHNLMIPNQQGNLVPLRRIAKTSKTQGVASYQHENNERQVKITGDIDTKISDSRVVTQAIKDKIPELKSQFPGVNIFFGGENQDTQESMDSLQWAFGIAVLSVYLILVLTFKNLHQPFLIMMTIPLGIISVIWTFFLHGMPLTFLGMMGVIALSGVIVNNAIVFIDFVNKKRLEGLAELESIVAAARLRLRPIFLTTLTTVCGILPTAYGIGGLDKFVVPIALALGWGMLFGSVLTLFVLPAGQAIQDDFVRFLKRLFAKQAL